jgi:hypothetical protein
MRQSRLEVISPFLLRVYMWLQKGTTKTLYAAAFAVGFAKTIQINRGGMMAVGLRERCVRIHGVRKILIPFSYRSIVRSNRQLENPFSHLHSCISSSLIRSSCLRVSSSIIRMELRKAVTPIAPPSGGSQGSKVLLGELDRS